MNMKLGGCTEYRNNPSLRKMLPAVKKMVCFPQYPSNIFTYRVNLKLPGHMTDVTVTGNKSVTARDLVPNTARNTDTRQTPDAAEFRYTCMYIL